MENSKASDSTYEKNKICSFEEKCYRRNPIHLKEFRHPHLEKLVLQQTDKKNVIIPFDFKLAVDKEIVIDQLKIMISHNIGPQLKRKERPDKIIENVSKRNKTSSDSQNVASTSTSSNSTMMASSSKNNNLNSSDKETKKVYNIKDFVPVIAPKGQFAKKLEKAAPYNIFYTTVTDSVPTHSEPLSITFQELLDESLGKLSASLQINFLVEPGWLFAQYYFAGYRDKPLLILYGREDDDLKNIHKKSPNITAVQVQMQNQFGSHHTKMSLFQYDDGSMRVAVSTANLYETDWHNRTQGIWVSPKCLPLDPDRGNTVSGNGPTNFKNDLLDYLHSYRLPQLSEWLNKVRETDFSHINVFLVTSIQGQHRDNNFEKYGHIRLGSLLSKHCTIPQIDGNKASSWSIIAQCSSLGSFGPSPDAWLNGELRRSFSKETTKGLMSLPKLSVVYPSLENVKNSHNSILGGDCLPYSQETHIKQLWFEKCLCQWKASLRYRNLAVPHIKTYCRVSPDLKNMAWFLLTSANLSKAAWGFVPQSRTDIRLNIKSYEVGVLFLPQFVTGEPVFKIKNLYSDTNETDIFPFPYDLPLTPYTKDDEPFVWDYIREEMRKMNKK